VRGAGLENFSPDPLDRRFVGGEEAVIITLEVFVEVTLGDGGSLADQ
jgi:hypothetical protein